MIWLALYVSLFVIVFLRAIQPIAYELKDYKEEHPGNDDWAIAVLGAFLLAIVAPLAAATYVLGLTAKKFFTKRDVDD